MNKKKCFNLIGYTITIYLIHILERIESIY